MDDPMPVESLPVRRPLKRSASTASLPTPPRTHRKHARGRSRGSCDSDSDDHAVLSSDDEELHGARKKRRTGEASFVDNEEEFWMGDSAGLNSDTATTSSTRNNASKPNSVPLLYRRLLAQTAVDVAPVSPPPSHRKLIPVATPPSDTNVSDSALPVTPSPPFTPKTRAQKKAAQRDSPDNPFLVTPEKQTGAGDTAVGGSNSAPKDVLAEKPTITYVFRGVRRTVGNPFYNADKPYSPPPASKLPLEDPDYSPATNCPPKLLFPHARRANGKTSTLRGRPVKRSPSLSDDEEDDADSIDLSDIRPKLLDFGAPEKAANTQTLDEEFKTAGEPLSI